MDLRWVYDSFFIRDLVALAIPGAIVLVTLGVVLDPNLITLVSAWSWPAVLGFWVPVAYAIGLCMYHGASLLRLSASDHARPFMFLDPDECVTRLSGGTNSTEVMCWWHSACKVVAFVFQYPSRTEYEQRLRKYYAVMAERDTVQHLRLQINRQSVVKQVCGQFAFALLLLFVSSCFLISERSGAGSGVDAFVGLTQRLSFRVLIAAAVILFIVAHLRHARFQALMTDAFHNKLRADAERLAEAKSST